MSVQNVMSLIDINVNAMEKACIIFLFLLYNVHVRILNGSKSKIIYDALDKLLKCFQIAIECA